MNDLLQKRPYTSFGKNMDLKDPTERKTSKQSKDKIKDLEKKPVFFLNTLLNSLNLNQEETLTFK